MSTKEVEDFVDSSNQVSRILIAHFLAITMIVCPIIDREWAHRVRSTPLRTNLCWIDSIYEETQQHLRGYLAWPKAISQCVSEEMVDKKRPVSTISILRKNEGLSKGLF